MKSVKQQKSTRTKTANRTPAQKPKKLGLAIYVSFYSVPNYSL